MGGTRSSCTRDEWSGGCIPEKVDYGVAVHGIMDPNSETLPLQLSVDRWDEPHCVKGEKSAKLTGTLSAHGLRAGESYLLLRYSDASDVPKTNFASASSRSAAATVLQFVANASEWTYMDPMPIESCMSAFYRLVADASSVII